LHVIIWNNYWNSSIYHYTHDFVVFRRNLFWLRVLTDRQQGCCPSYYLSLLASPLFSVFCELKSVI
jgi:hypothetical protein